MEIFFPNLSLLLTLATESLSEAFSFLCLGANEVHQVPLKNMVLELGMRRVDFLSAGEEMEDVLTC